MKMLDTPLLDWVPPARATDPETSHDAAWALIPHLPELELLVWRQLSEAGPAGMTVDELVTATGLEKVTVSPRLRPLANKGLVRESGTRPGKSGRQQTVWVLA